MHDTWRNNDAKAPIFFSNFTNIPDVSISLTSAMEEKYKQRVWRYHPLFCTGYLLSYWQLLVKSVQLYTARFCPTSSLVSSSRHSCLAYEILLHLLRNWKWKSVPSAPLSSPTCQLLLRWQKEETGEHWLPPEIGGGQTTPQDKKDRFSASYIFFGNLLTFHFQAISGQRPKTSLGDFLRSCTWASHPSLARIFLWLTSVGHGTWNPSLRAQAERPCFAGHACIPSEDPGLL